MKIRYAIGLTVLMLILPTISHAAACNTVNIPAFLSTAQKIQTIRTALIDYVQGGMYGICFQMEPLELNSSDFITPFYLNIPVSETKDVYVKGLKLTNKLTNPVTDLFFKVSNNGTGKVILEDYNFKDVKSGFLSDGTGGISLVASIIAGDSAKSGSCIDVKSPGAVLSGVQASSCHEGVKVDADNVMVKDESVVMGNHIGIHVLSGRTKTKIESTLVYHNDDADGTNLRRNDGVRVDDNVLHEVVFYDVVNNEPVPQLDGDNLVNYESRTAYLLMDVPEGKTGEVEFYVSEDAGCGLSGDVYSYQQACGKVIGMTNPVILESAALASGPVKVILPPQYLDKSLVAIYNDPDRGTAGISRQFEVNESSTGVVAFVANPYDIPTSGGVTDAGTSGSSDDDDDSDSATTGASSMGGDGAMAEGGSGIIGAANAAGGCGGGSSLMGLAWHDASLGGILWCLLLALGSIASMRMVQVKVRRKQ